MTDMEDLDLDSLMDLINDDEDFKPNSSFATNILEAKPKDEVPIQKTVDLENLELKVPQKSLFSLEMGNSNVKPTVPGNNSEVHTGLTDSSDEEDRKYLSEAGMSIKKKLAKASNHRHDVERKKIQTWKDQSSQNISPKEQDCTVDPYSGIRIKNPLVPFDVMQQRMQGRRMIKMSFIRNFIRGGDIDGDWVTMGVLVKKVPPKTSKSGKTFSLWKLTDLHDCDKIVTLFLFGAAHSDHWKTAVGTVVGILNSDIMPDKDKKEELSLSVNHPGKVLIMGTSKDFGNCKAQKKDGGSCNMIVNLSQCQYCQYHVQREYKKFSGQRYELQATYSGRDTGFKSRVLKGENFFYAGQSFVPLGKKPSKTIKTKDRITLSSLPLKRKAEAIEAEERNKGIHKLTEIYGPEISKVATNNSEFINNQLTVPTAGSRNLLLHMMKTKAEEKVKVITTEQLRKLQQNTKNQKGKDDSIILKSLTPELGKGLSPGQNVMLDFPLRGRSKSFSREDLAKFKAIKTVKEQGPIKKKDPNSVKKILSKPIDIEKFNIPPDGNAKSEEQIYGQQNSKLASIDLNSKKIQQILNRKSSHAYEIQIDEMEREAAYFNRLEKKEQLELKMASTTEIVCDVVSCRKCKYTADSAADRCKTENHPLKCHKALKRFFACKDCTKRTFCFTQFPTKACRECGGSNFERTGMARIRRGPKTDAEILNICSDEAYFLNSLTSL